MRQTHNGEWTFTGRHMLLVMVAFFGVTITVNLVLAFFATSSWTGLIVKNSYVASQEYNEKLAEARAQDALGVFRAPSRGAHSAGTPDPASTNPLQK